MSWDGYIDSIVGHGQGNCDRACIIGLNDGAPWTSATHGSALVLQGGEGATISAAFTSGDFSSFQANGVNVAGVKYQFLRETEGTIVLAKKKDQGSVTLQKTQTAVLIGHTRE